MASTRPPVNTICVTESPPYGVTKYVLNKELNVFANATFSSRLIVGLAAVWFVSRAHAITITLAYANEDDPSPQPENPTWDPVGTTLKQHLTVAKEIWEALLPGGGDYFVQFKWDDDLAANVQGSTSYSPFFDLSQMNHNFSWFADNSPEDNAEFTLVQSLYNGLPKFSQSTYFPGTAPPATLEVDFVGP